MATTLDRATYQRMVAAWSDFGPEWRELRTIMAANGALFPPNGSATDDRDDPEPSARSIVFRALDFRRASTLALARRSRSWGELVGRIVAEENGIRELVQLDEREQAPEGWWLQLDHGSERDSFRVQAGEQAWSEAYESLSVTGPTPAAALLVTCLILAPLQVPAVTTTREPSRPTLLAKAAVPGRSLRGVASWGCCWPAVVTRLPRRTRITVCGRLGCWSGRSVGYGPAKFTHRIADLSAGVFERICGPLSAGLCTVTLSW